MILGGDVGGFHLETKNVLRATSDTPKKLVKLRPWTPESRTEE